MNILSSGIRQNNSHRETRAFIYARQSSGGADTSASVELQIENCRKLAEEANYKVIEVFQDLNASGKTYPDTPDAIAMAEHDTVYTTWQKSTYSPRKRNHFRQGLGKMLGMLESADAVIVDDFTRLMRPLTASYLESYMRQTLKCHQIELYSVKEGVMRLESFTDTLTASILAKINAQQIDHQRKKSKAALNKLKDTGYRATGSNFRGYRFVKHQTYEIEPQGAEVVRLAFKLGLRYLPYQQICRTICREFGFKTVDYGVLKGIYNRPEYAGYQYNTQKELIPSNCFKDIPLISLADFLKMQERFHNKRVFNHDRKEVYAFSGLCYCGYCGSRMTITSNEPMPKAKEKQRLHFLSCHRNTFGQERKGNCSLTHTRYQYYVNQFDSTTQQRYPVTEASLRRKYIPEKMELLGLFESLMPLVALPVIQERRRLKLADNIQTQLQQLEDEKRNRMEYGKKLSKMHYAGQIDDEQFTSMLSENKQEYESIVKKLEEVLGLSAIDKNAEEEFLLCTLFAISRKHMDKYLYKKYAQATIRKIHFFAYHIMVEFMNGKQLTLERIPERSARVLPNWSLDIVKDKAHIKYYYKSFFSGDTSETELFDDATMRIVAVGRNPLPGEYLRKKSPGSQRTQTFLTKIADT